MSSPVTDTAPTHRPERSAAVKFLFVLIIGLLLSIPLLTVYLLNWDRQKQSETAQSSITQGWGDRQVIAGPLLAIPYTAIATETVEDKGKSVTRKVKVERELFVAPEKAAITTKIKPDERRRSIYQAVVYDAVIAGTARFTLPKAIDRLGISRDSLAYDRAELRFGVSDVRGLSGAPVLTVDGARLALEPGHGPAATNGRGFHAPVDARALAATGLSADFRYAIRGSKSLTLSPNAGETRWTVNSPWPNPSFQGAFLPAKREVGDAGFSAEWSIGNLALGSALASTSDREVAAMPVERYVSDGGEGGQADIAQIDLIQTVDLYDQVNRATKYGFLFIGFTFVGLLLFDVIGGVRLSAPGYALVGSGLVLFFVILLALAEVIGFGLAYGAASLAMIGLITAYCTAILQSRKRAMIMGAMLAGLYAILFVLLSLEAYSLLIGSLLLFAALAGVMYVTRNLDWSAKRVAST